MTKSRKWAHITYILKCLHFVCLFSFLRTFFKYFFFILFFFIYFFCSIKLIHHYSRCRNVLIPWPTGILVICFWSPKLELKLGEAFISTGILPEDHWKCTFFFFLQAQHPSFNWTSKCVFIVIDLSLCMFGHLDCVSEYCSCLVQCSRWLGDCAVADVCMWLYFFNFFYLPKQIWLHLCLG